MPLKIAQSANPPKEKKLGTSKTDFCPCHNFLGCLDFFSLHTYSSKFLPKELYFWIVSPPPKKTKN